MEGAGWGRRWCGSDQLLAGRGKALRLGLEKARWSWARRPGRQPGAEEPGKAEGGPPTRWATLWALRSSGAPEGTLVCLVCLLAHFGGERCICMICRFHCFKLCHSVALITVLRNHHHCLLLELFHHPEQKLCPRSNSFPLSRAPSPQ